MSDIYSSYSNQNYVIDFESPNYNSYSSEMRIISEVDFSTSRTGSMETVLDQYINTKAVPLVLRKRLMYERSVLGT